MSEIQKGSVRYAWNKGTTNFTNKSTNWIVIVGVSSSALEVDADVFQVVDQAGQEIDGFEFELFGTAANETPVGIPRKMLVPPNSSVNCTNSIAFSYVTCYEYGGKTSLENALAIL